MTHTETVLTTPSMVLSSTPSLQDFKVRIARYSLPNIKPRVEVKEPIITASFRMPMSEAHQITKDWLDDPQASVQQRVNEGSYSPEHKSTAVVPIKDLDSICNHPELVTWEGENFSGAYEIAVTSVLFDTKSSGEYFLPMIDLVDPGENGSWEETFERLKNGPLGSGEWGAPLLVWSGKSAHMYWPEPRPSVEYPKFLGWLVKQAARGAAIDLIWLGCALERGYLSLRLTGNIKPLPQVIDCRGDEGSLNSICETLYLTSIPGMTETIKRGMGTPAEEMSEMPSA